MATATARIPGALPATLETVRRTHNAHASVIDALERAFDAEMDQLAKDRRAFEDDRAAFIKGTEEKLARDDEEQTRMRAAAPPPGERIKLNVGGARFEVSRVVLTKVEDSMLGRMFGRCDAMLQADPEDGSIFIDRDGERFGTLLDFLRGDPPDGPRMQRAIRALPEAVQNALVQELDYFGLEAAVFGERLWTDDAAFQPGPEMGSDRADSAAVFAGGRVIVFGGIASEDLLNTTALLDAQTLAFTAGPDMLTRRYGCAAVQIDTDRFLVMGGFGGADDNFFNTTEIFHLSTLTLTPGPNMQSARDPIVLFVLDGRRILVVGGDDLDTYWSSTEILSLDTMVFAPGPAMAVPRAGCAAVALDEHRILVADGNSFQRRYSTTEVLDIRTMTFAPGPSMSSERSYFAAVPVDARHVLVIGGQDASSYAVATTELLDVATMEFAPGPAMRTARYGCAAVRVDVTNEQPRVVVVGGRIPTTRGSDEDEDDEDDDEDDEDDDEKIIYLSSTEVLAVEHNRGAPAAQCRQ